MNEKVNIKKIIRETISRVLAEGLTDSDNKHMIEMRFKLLSMLRNYTDLHNSDEILRELSLSTGIQQIRQYLEDIIASGKSHIYIEKSVKSLGYRELCGINGHNKTVAFHDFVTNRGGDAIIVSQDFVRYIPKTKNVNLPIINEDGTFVGSSQPAMLYPTSKGEVFVEIAKKELYPVFNAKIAGDNIQILDVASSFELECILFAKVNGIVSCLNFGREDVIPGVESDAVIAMFNF